MGIPQRKFFEPGGPWGFLKKHRAGNICVESNLKTQKITENRQKTVKKLQKSPKNA